MDKINNKNSKQWSRLGPRAMFGQFMLEIAEEFDDLMILSADLGRSSGLDRFKNKYPKKYLSVGISEQNLIGVAAGLTKEGYKVFVTSFAPFLSMRASEQVRMNLGYMELPVNLVALGSGVSMGYLGNSHYGLEDIAIMRTIPNLKISSPADPSEMRKILYDYLKKTHGPSYIRLTGIPGSPNVYSDEYEYKLGENITLKKGNDLLIIASGSVVAQCLIAGKMLEEKGLKAEIINVHTIKPFDNKIIEKLKSFNFIITVEEHSIVGGLYSIISEKIASNSIKTNLFSISLPDKFGPTGTYNYLLDYHGLTGEKINQKILGHLNYKK